MMKLIFVFCLAFSATVYADLLDPIELACNGAQEGAECMVEGEVTGTCQVGECCRLDYSGEGGIPGSACSECLECKEAAAPTAGVATSEGGSNAGGVSTGGTANTSAPVDDNKDDSGCASNPTAPGSLGLLSLLIGFGLAVRLRWTRE